MPEKKEKQLLRKSELAAAAGVRESTIKYYSEIGIIPCVSGGDKLHRRFDKNQAIKRLKEIRKLKDKRYTIEEIVEHFKSAENV